MNFGEQFKKLRKEANLTQEQVAEQLHISRQAVSNWENNKNLPDIETIIEIAKTFHISLDELILGDDKENNITQKLIKDGSEMRRAHINLISICIGAALLVMGISFIIIKAFSVEYIDSSGVLHENFFLLPIGFLLIFCGVITFLSVGVSKIGRYIGFKLKERRQIRKETLDGE